MSYFWSAEFARVMETILVGMEFMFIVVVLVGVGISLMYPLVIRPIEREFAKKCKEDWDWLDGK
jgi:hypothetical protein